jgi:heterodisulfide reductase subunit A-like polyferredoxin/coenzyme F420-reducing hydrogenase delta subunit
MTHSSDSVLVLGGGIAGMAAAQTLGDSNIQVHLVETADRLGGHAATWACMATDECRQCGACLADDLVHQTGCHTHISVHLNTTLDRLEKTGDGFAAHLTSGETVTPSRIILATGFTPFDPSVLSGLQFDNQDHVITTAQLNQMLKQETLTGFLGNAAQPKIAFIQCVGSRNRKLDRDFCSQVCCKISLRHSDKLLHLLPDADITLFHMDLQTIGKETRCLAADLSTRMTLAQGVPAEILTDPDTDRLRVIVEDSDSGARVARTFDLVVLSIGMSPSEKLNRLAGQLNIRPNHWGFFNTPDASLADGIHVAGCAAGPKDILGSRQEGWTAAAAVLKELGHEPAQKADVLVWGDGSEANTIARTLAKNGHATVCFGRGAAADGLTFMDPGRILSVDGTAGRFTVRYEQEGRRNTLTCRAILAAPEPESQTVADQSDLSGALNLTVFADTPPDQLPEQIAIVLDYIAPETKAGSRLALNKALEARNAGRKITVIMNKMLVHGAQGQQIYDQARKAGVKFLRYNTPEDLQIQKTDTGFSLTLKEITLPGTFVTLHCDQLVVSRVPGPGPGIDKAARLLKQEKDREGFLQSPNVRHRLTQSPRKGIYFAGHAHDDVDDTDLSAELDGIMADLDFPGPAQNAGVEINQKKCAQCLTCLRICPHQAIVLNAKDRPEIAPDACFGCHLCVVNCPALAIESASCAPDRIAQQAENGQTVVLACQRSAALAAGPLTLPDPVRLISVPCASSAGVNLMLKLLVNGAARVIVAGCHDGNCRSMNGSIKARKEIARVQTLPGITPDQVTWHSVAANETQRFARIISNTRIS